MAISVAPPPGAKVGLNTTLRATDMASAKLRSISFSTSLDGPRKRIVHALGVVHLVRKVKYLTMPLANPIGDARLPNSLVAHLFNVKQPTLGPNVVFAQVFYSVDDGRSNSSRNPVVVGFTHPAKDSDIVLQQHGLCIVCKAMSVLLYNTIIPYR